MSNRVHDALRDLIDHIERVTYRDAAGLRLGTAVPVLEHAKYALIADVCVFTTMAKPSAHHRFADQTPGVIAGKWCRTHHCWVEDHEGRL